jgi:hypothetical protein
MSSRVSIDELTDCIGEDAVQRLIDSFAGRSCYFNKKPKAIEFPDQESKELFARNSFRSGSLTVSEIADYLELSDGQVRRMIKND